MTDTPIQDKDGLLHVSEGMVVKNWDETLLVPGWYFFDETGDLSVVYSTKEAALRGLQDYIHFLNTGEISNA